MQVSSLQYNEEVLLSERYRNTSRATISRGGGIPWSCLGLPSSPGIVGNVTMHCGNRQTVVDTLPSRNLRVRAVNMRKCAALGPQLNNVYLQNFRGPKLVTWLLTFIVGLQVGLQTHGGVQLYLIVADHWVILLSSAINDGLDCIEGVTEGLCGEVAAKYRRHIESLFLQPVAELFLCELGKCKWPFCSPLSEIKKT